MQLIKKSNSIAASMLFLIWVTFASGVSAQAADNEKHKISFLKKIMLELFYKPKLKTEIKHIFKNPDKGKVISGVDNFFNFIDVGESDEKQKILKETPCAYYTFQGIYWTYIKKNPGKAYVAFSMASSIWSERDELTDKDGTLMDLIVRLMEKFGIGGPDFKIKGIRALVDWMQEKTNQYTSGERGELLKWNNDLEGARLELNALLKGRDGLAGNRDSLEKKTVNKSIRIEGITPKNYRRAQEALDEFIKNGGTDAINLTQELLEGVVIHITEKVPTEELETTSAALEYQLGKHCDYTIKETSNQVVRNIFTLMDFKSKYAGLPIEYRDRVVIKVKLKGKADGHRIRKSNGSSVIKYKGEDIDMSYFSNSEQRQKKAVFKNGTPIDNDQLAFLRAYCAYQSIDALMHEYGIDKNNVVYTLESDVSTKKGAQYRGVDTDIRVSNMYDFYLEQIKNLSDEIRELEEKIRRKQQNIEELKQLIGKKKKEIKDRELGIKQSFDLINQQN